MAEVIELKRGQSPRAHERYAVVLVSAWPPKEGGAAIALNDGGRAFFAFNNLQDVAAVLARAKVWADENIISRVYVRRD